MSIYTHKPRGIALVLVLVVVAVATTLGISYALAASVRASSSANMAMAVRARYLAESGSQHALYLLKYDTATLQASTLANALGPFYVDGSSDSYKLFAAPGSGVGNVYTVSSTGWTGAISQSVSISAMVLNQYSTLVQAFNPVAYWRLGDSLGLTASDEKGAFSGVYSNGVILGQSGALNAANNTCASFDGYDDFVALENMDIPTNEVTFLAWFKLDNSSVGDPRIISKATSGDDTYWMLYADGDGLDGYRLQFELQLDGSTKEVHGGRGEIRLNQWAFAAATYDGNTMVIYLNGVEIKRKTESGNIGTDAQVPASIGGSPYSATASPWDGLIDEVAILPTALSANQIATLYQARIPDLKIISWDD